MVPDESASALSEAIVRALRVVARAPRGGAAAATTRRPSAVLADDTPTAVRAAVTSIAASGERELELGVLIASLTSQAEQLLDDADTRRAERVALREEISLLDAGLAAAEASKAARTWW